jgi:RNA-directed DNA polymerase
MALYNELPVYNATYDLLLAIFRFTKDFVKEYKYTVGESLKKEPIELLTLHPKKIYLKHYSNGVKFLGTVIKPNRIHIANRTKGNFYNAIEKQNKEIQDHKPTKGEKAAFLSSMNSYLGIMKHYKAINCERK